jgi:hypothetical protein
VVGGVLTSSGRKARVMVLLAYCGVA